MSEKRAVNAPLGLRLAAAYLRKTPMIRGRWRLLRRYLPLMRQWGPRMRQRVIRTRYGFRMVADPGDWLGQYLYLTGGYEPPTAHVIWSLLEPGGRFVDVGANAGFFTLLGATRVGASGNVHAFEPVPAVRDALVRNIELNGFSNVQVSDNALSNIEGRTQFHVGPADHRGISSLRRLETASEIISVPTTKLDTLDIGQVDLIKLDVEGAELLALEGMERTLRESRPHLVVEITDCFLDYFGASASSLCTRLLDLGYRLFEIGPNGLEPVREFPEEWPEQFNGLFTVDKQVSERIPWRGLK